MGLKIYTPRRSRGEVNKWLRHIKTCGRLRRPPRPAERQGFNSGSSDVTPPFAWGTRDGDDGDPNLNAVAVADDE